MIHLTTMNAIFSEDALRSGEIESESSNGHTDSDRKHWPIQSKSLIERARASRMEDGSTSKPCICQTERYKIGVTLHLTNSLSPECPPSTDDSFDDDECDIQ
eukprot:700816_1